MNFEYSAFDVSKIIDCLEKRNITLSFEKVEDLYQGFEDIFPVLLDAKARSRKYFQALINTTCYDSETAEIKNVSRHNPYSDAGVIFDDQNRKDIENMIQFLEYFPSLKNTYFFESSNIFGSSFTPNMEYILHTEYNLNYIPLNIFSDVDLKKYVNFIPKLYEFCSEKIDDIRKYDIGVASIIVNPDSTPKKFNFYISVENFLKWNLSYDHKEELEKLFNDFRFNKIMKIGFYFVGEEQNKWSISLGFDGLINNMNVNDLLKDKIKNEEQSKIVYEITLEDTKILEKNIIFSRG
jgi:hypothetical protein